MAGFEGQTPLQPVKAQLTGSAGRSPPPWLSPSSGGLLSTALLFCSTDLLPETGLASSPFQPHHKALRRGKAEAAPLAVPGGTSPLCCWVCLNGLGLKLPGFNHLTAFPKDLVKGISSHVSPCWHPCTSVRLQADLAPKHGRAFSLTLTLVPCSEQAATMLICPGASPALWHVATGSLPISALAPGECNIQSLQIPAWLNRGFHSLGGQLPASRLCGACPRPLCLYHLLGTSSHTVKGSSVPCLICPSTGIQESNPSEGD